MLIYLSHCLHKLVQFQTSAAGRPVPLSPHLWGPLRVGPGRAPGRGHPRAGSSPEPSFPAPPASPAGTKELGPVLTGPPASGHPGQLAQWGAVGSDHKTEAGLGPGMAVSPTSALPEVLGWVDARVPLKPKSQDLCTSIDSGWSRPLGTPPQTSGRRGLLGWSLPAQTVHTL